VADLLLAQAAIHGASLLARRIRLIQVHLQSWELHKRVRFVNGVLRTVPVGLAHVQQAHVQNVQRALRGVQRRGSVSET
jgi:hypothetical protein